MHMGELKFKQRGREEQAENDGTAVSANRGLQNKLKQVEPPWDSFNRVTPS